MNLIQCVTCGASSITNGKCDYCGNQYETETIFEEQKEQETTYTELRFQDTPAGKTLLKIMIYTLVSIIWFAATVLIPPLFIITIILLVVYCIHRLIIKRNTL
ncbi:hypothetical protein PhiB1127_36 [Lactococcus phage 936 group phage PhiB1127]|uniref:Uncharacterized protein n=1 Tax=Lactococcus phage 936 group phage PhiB1127 TaxID=1636573 RepID=A0A126H9F8_9CAUD|nr:hypothetical protein HYO82_gp36 [Lactococcus phage 936 group phage PhiB1127]ALM63225.1 hypothetical protein PhiB1127_36 [Lactococcus phage 936 group phage PhiB1127]